MRTCKIILGGNARGLIKHTASLTVESSLKGDQLSKLKREDENQVENILVAVVLNFNNSINVGNKMNQNQIYETSLAILEEYWMLKIDEILNCFKMAKSGKFGEIKRLDQPTVMGFLHQYDTKVKADYYANREHLPDSRLPKEDKKPKHIALSIDEIKKLKDE